MVLPMLMRDIMVPEHATGSGVPFIAVPCRGDYHRNYCTSPSGLVSQHLCVALALDPLGRDLTGPALVLAAGQSVL